MAILDIAAGEFENRVLLAKLPVLAEFYAPWCTYCKRLSPVLERLSEKLSGRVDIVKVNVDEFPELEDKYAVETLPSLIMFSGGKISEKLVNPASQAQIEKWIEEELGN